MQVGQLGEEARECGSRRSDEDLERKVFVMTGLFRDAAIRGTIDLLMPVELFDCGQVGGLSLLVPLDGGIDRVDCRRGRSSWRYRQCDGAGGCNGE